MRAIRTLLAKAATVFLVILIAVFIGCWLWLKSDSARHWALSRLNTKIPGQIRIGSHELTLFPPRVILHEATVHDGQDQPLAGFSRFHLRLDVGALLDRALRLDEVDLRAPWADLAVNHDGDLNLIAALTPPVAEGRPAKAPADGSSLPLTLVLPSISVSEGRVAFETAGGGTTLLLSGMSLSAEGNLGTRTGSLDVKIPDLRFTANGVNAQPAKVELKAHLMGDRLEIPVLKAASGKTELQLCGTLQGLPPNTILDTRLTLQSRLSDLTSMVALDGDYQGLLTATVTLNGKLDNPDGILALNLENGRIAGRSVDQADLFVRLQDRTLTVEDTNWRLAGGSIDLDGSIDLQTVFPSGVLSAPPKLDNITYKLDLAATVPDLAPWLTPFDRLRGQTTLTASIEGRGVTRSTLLAQLLLQANGRNLTAPGMHRPIDADAALAVAVDRDGINLSRLRVDADGAVVTGNGRLQREDRSIDAQLSLVADDLPQVLTVFGLPTISGACDLSLSAKGSLDRPHVSVDLTSTDLGVEQIKIGDLKAILRLAHGEVLLKELSLANGGSLVTASGEAQLFSRQRFRPVDTPTFALAIESDRLNLEDFVDTASGAFTFMARFSGPAAKPTGRLTVAGERIRLPWQAVQTLSADARIGQRRLWLDRLSLDVASDERIQAKGWLDWNRTLDVHLWADRIAIAHVQALKNRFPGSGLLSADVRAAGDLANPKVDGELRLTEVFVNKEPMEDYQISLALHDRKIRVAGKANAELEVACDLNSGDFNALLRFDRSETAAYFKAAGIEDLRGTVTGLVRASGNIHRAARASAAVDLRHVHLLHKQTSLLRSENLSIRLDNQVVSIPGFEAALLSSGHLRVEGEARLDGPLDLTVNGRIPLAAAAPFTDLLREANGFVSIEGKLSGEAEAPSYDVRIDLEEIGLALPELEQKLDRINGSLQLTPATLAFEQVAGYLDTGSFTLSGAIGHDRFQPLDADLRFRARSLPLELPETLALLANADIRIRAKNRQLEAGGEIVLLEGVYFKDVNISLLDIAASAATRRRAIPVEEKPVTLPYVDTVRLNIAVKHRAPFEVQNNLADLALRPDLTIGGTLAKPIINGRARVDDGTITFQRKTFAIQTGIVDFLDPFQTKAEIEIKSEAEIRDWTVYLAVEGTLDNLKFTLTSLPSESEADILSLILFGRTTREIADGKAGSQRTTGQIMAEMIADTFGDDIRRNTGIDIFEMQATEGENENDEGGVKVTLGKNLTDRMTVKYAVETVKGEARQWAIMEYKLFERILINGSQSANGLFGGELIYRIEFR